MYTHTLHHVQELAAGKYKCTYCLTIDELGAVILGARIYEPRAARYRTR